MTGPIEPIRRAGPAARANPEGEVAKDQAPPPRPRRIAAGAFDAQYLGQDGVKRGLRGGQEVLDTARAAYLETEYSGRNDRRPAKGRITKTEI